MTDIYIHFICAHYGLYGNAPVSSHGFTQASSVHIPRSIYIMWAQFDTAHYHNMESKEEVMGYLLVQRVAITNMPPLARHVQ